MSEDPIRQLSGSAEDEVDRFGPLAYAISTLTLDLSLPGERQRWGHLPPQTSALLARFVADWYFNKALHHDF